MSAAPYMSARVVERAVRNGADAFFTGAVIASEGGDVAFGLHLSIRDRAEYESAFAAARAFPGDPVHAPSAADARRYLVSAADELRGAA